MPVSDYHQIPDVLSVVDQLRPRRILDVGCGFGKWGVLCREVVDAFDGRVLPHDWEATIDGIEIFEGYRNPLWSSVYNNVIVGDAMTLLESLPDYDLILACDVIEHFEKNEGNRFLNAIMQKGKVCIVTSPRGYFAQDACWGNPHEEHKSGWGQDDFLALSHIYKDIGFTFMAVVSHEKDRIESLQVLTSMESIGIRRGSRELARLISNRLYRKK